MGFKAKQMLQLRVLIVALFLGFALLLSVSITAYTKSKYKPRGPRIESQCCKNPSKLPHPVAKALIHYAASNITPQQTPAEINITAKSPARESPCNMLVFGLGYDSLMWSALNHGGKTVFLEEDEAWIGKMRSIHPELESHFVQYPTMVTEAYDLLKYAQSAPECAPWQGDLELSSCSRLALKNLPPHIYGTEWDLIMIDAPRGYFPEAPGRMQAIYSSAIMALNRQSAGNTDVFVTTWLEPWRIFSQKRFFARRIWWLLKGVSGILMCLLNPGPSHSALSSDVGGLQSIGEVTNGRFSGSIGEVTNG